VLYPQNGDRIVTADSVTSLHPVHGPTHHDSAVAPEHVGFTRQTTLNITDLRTHHNQTCFPLEEQVCVLLKTWHCPHLLLRAVPRPRAAAAPAVQQSIAISYTAGD